MEAGALILLHLETEREMETDLSPALRRGIKAAVAVIIAGYLFLLVMNPTDFYYHGWIRKLRTETATTYFGTSQGANLLVYTFPVVLVSVLGCVYLHLGKKLRVNGGRRSGVRRRPVVIKGLGIVSVIEVSILSMFVALLVWNLAKYLGNDFAKITAASAAHGGMKLWQARLDLAGLRLGLVGNLALIFLFFPVTRGSSILSLFGLTSESSIKYHIWLGHIVMALFTAHGSCYVVYWAATQQITEMLKWQKSGVSNVAGEISLAAGLGLWAATFPGVRRRVFELFFYSHHLYILFVVFFVLHLGISFASMMLPGFFLFVIDRYLRLLQSRRRVRVLSARVLPCDTVELTVSKTKSLCYTATSILFMNLPEISKLQWHPFTITSSSNFETDKLTVVLKREGIWTSKLYEILSSPSPVDRLHVSLEGPYGPASTSFLGHDTLVMISGGSGITPFISIIRELIYSSQTLNQEIPEILLISSFKNSADLTMLDLILPISATPPKLSSFRLRIEAYVTRESHPPNEKKGINTIWFKPSPSDSPMSPILGRNGWLWLAVIISCSFIMYLILIGFLTRFYIYPIDHNTNMIYPVYSRALLHMLFICSSIVVVSTTAFLWTKSVNAKEVTQIQNTEALSPDNSSPGSADVELESLPQESLSQSTNVHYGERPDFKRILFERKESSVRVLVCGPKRMRYEVAKICSTGLADNLHFESISFTW